MVKLTEQTIQDLYSFGKSVFNREIDLLEATEQVLKRNPDLIAESSAKFYIGLYADYISGKGSTWNQNSSLVLYYVVHIYDELGLEAGKKAYTAGMYYANAKSKNTLKRDLDNLLKKMMSGERLNSSDMLEISNEEDWYPDIEEYDSQITKDKWIELLNMPDIGSNEVYRSLAFFYNENNGATCTEIGNKYSVSPQSVSGICTQLAKKVYSVTGCPLYNDGKKDKYWPVLFLGRDAGSEQHGDFVWKLRKELYEALTEFGILRYLPEEKDEEILSSICKPEIECIKENIASRGFSYRDELIENFFLSLKSKPFVILAGTSGTGKTRLVKLFAEAIGAEYELVSVRPDWSDGSDLFGHTDLNGKFIPGPVCKAFDKAYADREKPVFLCLDEMNLARVEYYLSDFLSVIESREKQPDGGIVTSEIAQYKEGIPDNLYVVGTVNMDETTFPFSKKVLDRANTIEFSYVDLVPDFSDAAGDAEPLNVGNDALRAEYLVLARDCADEKEYVESICEKLQALNAILVKANAHIGYRVRDEIVFYMLNNRKAGQLLSEEKAFDNEIMQKILPRIQGSSVAIKALLTDLFKYCLGNASGLDTDSGNLGEHMQSLANSAIYPASATKLAYMMTRYEEDGFTSYWL